MDENFNLDIEINNRVEYYLNKDSDDLEFQNDKEGIVINNLINFFLNDEQYNIDSINDLNNFDILYVLDEKLLDIPDDFKPLYKYYIINLINNEIHEDKLKDTVCDILIKYNIDKIKVDEIILSSNYPLKTFIKLIKFINLKKLNID